MNQKVFFKTFGCRTNIYDTQIMKSQIKDFTIVKDEGEADIIVVNSCTVTNGADSNVRSYINAWQNKRVILAGCGSFSKGEELFKAQKVDGVIGHSEKEHINTHLQNNTPLFELGTLNAIDSTIVTDYENRSRAFLKIQEGCNFNCSYCIIPSVRGSSRSQDEQKILQQVKSLASNGFGEFILTGINVGSYGADKATNLAQLMKKVSQVHGVRRIRVGSIEPSQINEEFREILQEPWLERHLHIALQHTSDTMLKIMRRRGSINTLLPLFEEIASKGFALGTDFITGHPGESEPVWQEALKNFRAFPLTHLHGFTFSKRDGTHSATMKIDVKGDRAKERLKELNAIIKEKNYRFRIENHRPLNVLVEEHKNGHYIGYDQYFNKIQIDSTHDIKKDWVEITHYKVNYEGNSAQI
jgi:MiaB-like tRNA modifying enzyme